MLNIKHTPIKMLYFTYQPKCMWLASHFYSYYTSLLCLYIDITQQSIQSKCEYHENTNPVW